nr:MAG TPA: hypothetical protein [Caudoviricetes sp.]
MEKIKGYKGFNKDMKCRGFQYEVGKEYEIEGEIKCCERGFHFCENPLEVLSYYPPATSRFCKVEGSGKVDKIAEDSKVSVSNLHIGLEIGLSGLIQAGIKFILDKVNSNGNRVSNTGYQSAATNTGYQSAATNTGYQSAATNTGNYSVATNTGNYSAATNTGNYSVAEVKGEDSIAIAAGYNSKASGIIGCWLVLTERNRNYEILDVKAVRVDGHSIKENTFYALENGQIKETE